MDWSATRKGIVDRANRTPGVFFKTLPGFLCLPALCFIICVWGTLLNPFILLLLSVLLGETKLSRNESVPIYLLYLKLRFKKEKLSDVLCTLAKYIECYQFMILECIERSHFFFLSFWRFLLIQDYLSCF